MGRNSKLTPVVQKKIVKALNDGNYFDASCQYAGIAKTTGYNWLNRGRAEIERRENPRVKEGSEQWVSEQPFVDFLNAITRAEAEAEVTAVKVIRDAFPEDWRAASWYLERRRPDTWGKRVNEHTGKDGDAMEFKLIYPDDQS